MILGKSCDRDQEKRMTMSPELHPRFLRLRLHLAVIIP